jgi:hypothetical protein
MSTKKSDKPETAPNIPQPHDPKRKLDGDDSAAPAQSPSKPAADAVQDGERPDLSGVSGAVPITSAS